MRIKKVVASKKLTKKEIAEREAVIKGPLYTDVNVKRYKRVDYDDLKALTLRVLKLEEKLRL